MEHNSHVHDKSETTQFHVETVDAKNGTCAVRGKNK